MKAVEEWRSGGTHSSAKQRVASLVTSLEKEYAKQTRNLQTQHAAAVEELNKVVLFIM